MISKSRQVRGFLTTLMVAGAISLFGYMAVTSAEDPEKKPSPVVATPAVPPGQADSAATARVALRSHGKAVDVVDAAERGDVKMLVSMVAAQDLMCADGRDRGKQHAQDCVELNVAAGTTLPMVNIGDDLPFYVGGDYLVGILSRTLGSGTSKLSFAATGKGRLGLAFRVSDVTLPERGGRQVGGIWFEIDTQAGTKPIARVRLLPPGVTALAVFQEVYQDAGSQVILNDTSAWPGSPALTPPAPPPSR